MDKRPVAASIDEYIADFPEATQVKLRQMRQIIHDAAPEATEKISYAIPTFYLNGNLVHFGGFANHIGFYPTGKGAAAFADELSKYASGKGSVQFPLDEPIPEDLVRRIVEFRVGQNASKPKK
jgi:uncharacterized protein YdhG (YjbR/CyaY superfamily)